VEAGGRPASRLSGIAQLRRQRAVADLIKITVVTAITLPMSTPSGLAGTICEMGAPSSSTMSSPQKLAP